MRVHAGAMLMAIVALLVAPQGCVAPMPPKPTFLVPKSFTTHPMRCASTSPLYVSYEWWWEDEDFERVTQPLGHAVQRGCVPYNQIIPRVGSYVMETMDHQSPAVFRDLQIRMWRPGFKQISGIQPLPACNRPTLMDPGLYYGPVGCKYDQYRSSLTPRLCSMGQGTVAKTYSLVSTDPSATRIDCRWRDAVPYDAAAVPASGNVMFELMTNHFFYPDTYVQPWFGKQRLARLDNRVMQVLGSVPMAMPDRTGAPCVKPYCNWHDFNAHTLEVKTWTDDTQFSVVQLTPVFLIPVGGLYRTTIKTSRIVEPPPVGARYPGYPVKRHIVTFDDDFRAGKSGAVAVNATGFLYDDLVVFNVSRLLAPGWHKMTVQAKTGNTEHKGVQTASLSTYIEVAPPCPPTSATPFFTHALTEGVEALMLREGRLIVRSGEDDYQTLVNSVPTQSLTYYKLSFDLSWLSPRTVVRTARLLLLLSKPLPTTAAYTGGGVKLEVWDGSKPLKSLCSAACPTGTNGKTCFLCPPNKAALPATVPCAQPGCAGTRVGWSTFRPGVNDTTYLDISLDAAFVGRYAGSATPLPLALTIPRFRTGFIDGAAFRGTVGPSAPFLLLTASCTATRG